MTRALCLDCGVVIARGPRCYICRRAYEARRRANPTSRYGPGYRARHRAAIEAEPWCHNPRCPYPDAGTLANPLTADHPLPIAAGGSPLQELIPLCRSCNASKADRTPERVGGPVGHGLERESGYPALGLSSTARIKSHAR